MAVFKPNESGDDCGWYSGTIDLTGVTFWMGNAGIVTDSGVRFYNVNIPPGSTITAAKVTLQAHENATNTTCNVILYGEAAADAAIFTTAANFAGRTRTGAHVHWDAIPAWTGTVDYDSPDITAVVQAVIDTVGWASGNHLVIFFTDNASTAGAQRLPVTYDDSSTNCARLTVTWTAPAGGVSIPIVMQYYQKLMAGG